MDAPDHTIPLYEEVFRRDLSSDRLAEVVGTLDLKYFGDGVGGW